MIGSVILFGACVALTFYAILFGAGVAVILYAIRENLKAKKS
jgi:hypothetical protein